MLFLYCLVSVIAIFLQRTIIFCQISLNAAKFEIKQKRYFYINIKLPTNFQLETGVDGLISKL